MASKKGRGHEKIMVESVWEAALRPKASKTHICSGKMGICGEFIYVLLAFVCGLGVRNDFWALFSSLSSFCSHNVYKQLKI